MVSVMHEFIKKISFTVTEKEETNISGSRMQNYTVEHLKSAERGVAKRFVCSLVLDSAKLIIC